MDWSRRFIIADPAFAALLTNTTTPTEQTFARSALLVKMHRTVSQYSKLLAGVKLEEVYYAVTTDTDYELGFLLLACKDDNRLPLFSLEQASAMLFGEPNLPNYSDFTDGLTEISCKFAAAKLINAFAIVEEQVKSADLLRKQADETLGVLIKAQQNYSKLSANTTGEEKIKQARIYFEDKHFISNAPLQVEFFLPTTGSTSGWVTAANYPAQSSLTVRQIILDLSIQINLFTLDPTRNANTIASVVQSGERGYPYLDFALRNYLLGYNADSISIRITSGDSAIPFNWGLLTSDLKPVNCNSCILLQRSPKDSKLSTTTANNNNELAYDCIYFRNKSNPPLTNAGQLSYRTSVTNSTTTVTTANVAPGIPRYSQEALALVDALELEKLETKLVGAIVRDDPETISSGMSGIRIVPWPITAPITYLVLEIRTLPTDIEIALGDLNGPQTTFTNLPLSLVCQPLFQRLGSGTTNANTDTSGKAVGLGKMRLNSSKDLNYDRHERITNITGFKYFRT
jgi:hypothetical protein